MTIAKNHPLKKSTIVRNKRSLIRTLVQSVSKINAKWGADFGINAFMTPLGKKKARPLPKGTTSNQETLNGKKLTVYRYGISVKKILLVHGWEGDVGDMSGFFEPLAKEGFEVIAVDLPGHGQSPFSQLNALVTAGIIEELENLHGPFSAVIGHSFGAFSLGYALSRSEQFKGTPFVSIGSPTRLKTVLSLYSNFVGLDDFQQKYINAKLETKYNFRISEFEQGKFMEKHQGPVFVVHDKFDKMVPIKRLEDIKKETLSPQFLVTEGLGHNRILKDPQTIEKVVDFVVQNQYSRRSVDHAVKYGVAL